MAIDGTTAVVAGYGTSLAHGAVYIYVKGRSGWPTSPTVTLPDPGGSNSDLFGNSVAIDGSTIVVGANGATVGSNMSAGAAYIYLKGRYSWPTKPTATLLDPAATSGDMFGYSPRRQPP